MKKTIIFAVLMYLTATLQAQVDFKQQLKELETSLSKNNYEQANASLNKIRQGIRELQANAIVAELFPTELEGGYKLTPDSKTDKNQVGERSYQVIRSYKKSGPLDKLPVSAAGKEAPKGDVVMIAVNNTPELMSEIATAYSKNKNEEKDNRIYKTLMIDKYRALLVYEAENKFGSLAVIAGGSTIQIDADNLFDPEVLIKIAKTINYAKVIERFGM